MEILSDSIFKGNVSINGGDFSVTRKGDNDPFIQTNKSNYALYVDGSEFIRDNLVIGGFACVNGRAIIGGCLSILGCSSINGRLCIGGGASITGNLTLNGSTISSWDDFIPGNVKLKNPKIPAGCNKFYFSDPEKDPNHYEHGFATWIQDRIPGKTDFHLTQVYDANTLTTIQMEIGLEPYDCSGTTGVSVFGNIANHTDEINAGKYVVVVM